MVVIPIRACLAAPQTCESNATHLTYNQGNDFDPVWSPDGYHIAFSSNRDGNTEIYWIAVTGNGETRLSYFDAFDGEIIWSP